MRKFGLLAVVVACLSGCLSARHVRESDQLGAPPKEDSAEITALLLTEGAKGPTPRSISVTRVMKEDGVTLDHVRVLADVSKYTDMMLCTPENSPKKGRHRVVVQREAHGVFRIPAKYLLDYDLTHAYFVDPWDPKHPFTPTTFSEITATPPSDWHGVACVDPGNNKGHLLCLIDALPAGPRRTQHQVHATGAPDAPDVASEKRLPAEPPTPPAASPVASTGPGSYQK